MVINKLLALLALIALVTGCAGDFGTCRAPVGDPTLTPNRYVADPVPAGEWVTWGGALVESRHQRDTTELEVVAYPLNDCGRPQLRRPSLGRFIVVYPGYLETAELSVGRLITATGELLGVREGEVGAVPYRFALLEDPAPRLWSEASQAYGGSGWRPVFSIGLGAGSGWGGGVGVHF